jgi:hypothetical protein
LTQRYPAPNTAALLAQMLREPGAAASFAEQAPTPALAIVAAEEDSPERVTALPQRSPNAARYLPQAAAAALLVIAGWSLWNWSADKPLAPVADTNRFAGPASDRPLPDPEVLPVTIPAPIAPQEFQTLSAPEREAVLDLLEEQALGTVSLSI